MAILKKLSVGAWITCCAAVLALVALIAYSVNIGSEGYFQDAAVSNLVLWSILAIVLFLCAIVLSTLDLKGGAAVAVKLVSGILQIVAPVLLAAALINLVASRVEGLGFIYFSNADVILEVQTPANLSSATGTIASMVLFGVAMLVGIIAAFCSLRKKDA